MPVEISPNGKGKVVAWASLGDNVDSVREDTAHMKGSLHSVGTLRYVKHQIKMPTGQVVREFVAPDFDLPTCRQEYLCRFNVAVA